MEILKFSLRAPITYSNRETKEKKHEYRTEFMRDRDRIMYSKAFRRLSSKTQIFIAGFDDHVRNRLTHTLEVSQISRTISQFLKLDVDLTEAIALGHDLGHTPFGHIGERTLNNIMNACDPMVRDYLDVGVTNISFRECDMGFKHNLQSLRIAIDLESPGDYKEQKGLNLTNYTLFGLKSHTKSKWDECKYKSEHNCYFYTISQRCNRNDLSIGYYDKYNKYVLNEFGKEAWSFEAFVVALADEIAQRHHDMEDAIESKLLDSKQAIELIKEHFYEYLSVRDKQNFKELINHANSRIFLLKLSRFLINFFVNKTLLTSVANLKEFIAKYSLKNMKDFEVLYPKLDIEEVSNIISFNSITEDDGFSEAHESFKETLKNIVLNSHSVHRMDSKARFIIRKLFKAYLANPQQLPDKTINSLFREFNHPDPVKETNTSKLRNQLEQLKKLSLVDVDEKSNAVKFRVALLRTICDYIAGMTDSYAMKEFKSLYH